MYTNKTIIFFLFIIFFSCHEVKKNPIIGETKEVAIPEKIAHAHGYANWKTVNSIRFTFNVDRDSTHFERTWVWQPKTNDVTSISGQDSLQYNRGEMDSTAFKANAGLINDRYWLLTPFNLMWDSDNYKYEHTTKVKAPISGDSLQKLTIVYRSEGGYTPGDAYDLYFGDDYLIQEWVFRKGNQSEPSMTTTFENYTEQNGLKLALDHKKDGEDFNLYFTDLEISSD